MLYIEFRSDGVCMFKTRQSVDCQTSWQSYYTFVLVVSLQQVVEFIALAQALGNLAHCSIHFTLSPALDKTLRKERLEMLPFKDAAQERGDE